MARVIPHNPASVGAPVGNYSQGVEVLGGRWLLISGQTPEDASGQVPGDFEAQAEQVWRKIGDLLASAGMDFSHLVKVTTYLTHPDQIETNSCVRQRVLGEARPALTVVIVSTLDPRWRLEVEAMAVM